MKASNYKHRYYNETQYMVEGYFSDGSRNTPLDDPDYLAWLSEGNVAEKLVVNDGYELKDGKVAKKA